MAFEHTDPNAAKPNCGICKKPTKIGESLVFVSKKRFGIEVESTAHAGCAEGAGYRPSTDNDHWIPGRPGKNP